MNSTERTQFSDGFAKICRYQFRSFIYIDREKEKDGFFFPYFGGNIAKILGLVQERPEGGEGSYPPERKMGKWILNFLQRIDRSSMKDERARINQH